MSAQADAPAQALAMVLEEGNLSLQPFRPEHAAPLRAACARDLDIWDIYPVNMLDGDAEAMLKRFHGEQGWVRLSVLVDGVVVGTTSYINPDPINGTVMIGGTYIEPAMRGTDVNRRMKRLMIDHAIQRGFWRIEFTVDTRNARSMAAMEKLGAVREGILRKNRVTWTGYVRDTALYAILADDWRAANS